MESPSRMPLSLKYLSPLAGLAAKVLRPVSITCLCCLTFSNMEGSSKALTEMADLRLSTPLSLRTLLLLDDSSAVAAATWGLTYTSLDHSTMHLSTEHRHSRPLIRILVGEKNVWRESHLKIKLFTNLCKCCALLSVSYPPLYCLPWATC